MPTELIALAAAGVINLALVLAQGAAKLAALGPREMAGPRDREAETALPQIASRLQRALRNFLETFPAFIALVLAAVLSDRTGGLAAVGAWMYVAGRLAHAPLYAVGATYIRGAAWWLAMSGMIAIALGLAFGG